MGHLGYGPVCSGFDRAKFMVHIANGIVTLPFIFNKYMMLALSASDMQK